MRIEDRLWAESQATAADQGENVVDVVRRALSAYNIDPNALDAAIAAIRGGKVDAAG
jgi:hypothetical protein